MSVNLKRAGKKAVICFDIPDLGHSGYYWATYPLSDFEDKTNWTDGNGKAYEDRIERPPRTGMEVERDGGLANVDSIFLEVQANDSIIEYFGNNPVEDRVVDVYFVILESFNQPAKVSNRYKFFSGAIDNYKINGNQIEIEITHRSLIESENICEDSAKDFVMPIIYINSKNRNSPFYQPPSSSPLNYLNKIPSGRFLNDEKYFYFISKNNPNELISVWVKTDNGFDEILSPAEIKNVQNDSIRGGYIKFKTASTYLGVKRGYILEIYGENKKIQARRNNFGGSFEVWKERDNIKNPYGVNNVMGLGYLSEEFKFDDRSYFIYDGTLVDGEKMVLRVNFPKFDLDPSNRDIYYKINFDTGITLDPYYYPDVKLKIQSKLMSDGVTLNQEDNFLADDNLRKISKEPHNHGTYVDIFLANDSGSKINFQSNPLYVKLVFERFTYDKEVNTSEKLCIETDSQYNKLDSILENLMTEEIGYDNFTFVNSNEFPNLSTYFNTTESASKVVNDICDKNCIYGFYDSENKLKLKPVKLYEDLESPKPKNIFVDDPSTFAYDYHGIIDCDIEKTSASEIINNLIFKYGYDPIDRNYTERIGTIPNINENYVIRKGTIESRYVSKDSDAEKLYNIKYEKLSKPAWIANIVTTVSAIELEIGDVIGLWSYEAQRLFSDEYINKKWVVIGIKPRIGDNNVGLINIKAYYME